MNLETAIKGANQILNNIKIKSALLDSELLLSKAINKSREFILLNLNYNLSDKEYYYFQKLINKTFKGKP